MIEMLKPVNKNEMIRLMKSLTELKILRMTCIY